MIEVSRTLLPLTWWQMSFHAVSAVFLIAAMVWMIPTSENQQFIVITLMTWLIAVTGATHIVAGSMEAYLLALAGEWPGGKSSLNSSSRFCSVISWVGPCSLR